MNKEIENAIEALRVGIRNAQAGSRNQEADMSMRAIEGLRNLQQLIAVSIESLLKDEFTEGSAQWNACIRYLHAQGYLHTPFTASNPQPVSAALETLKLFYGLLNALNNDFVKSGHPSPIPIKAIELKYKQALAILNKHGGNNA